MVFEFVTTTYRAINQYPISILNIQLNGYAVTLSKKKSNQYGKFVNVIKGYFTVSKLLLKHLCLITHSGEMGPRWMVLHA